jgi:hypothetical protein
MSAPIPMTYSEFGRHVGDESPYAVPEDVTFAPGFNDPTTGVTRIVGSAGNPLGVQWDFRHARSTTPGDPPWEPEPEQPDRLRRPLKLRNYTIVKAMLVPYTYHRRLPSNFGGFIDPSPTSNDEFTFPGNVMVGITIKAHLLVGYTESRLRADLAPPQPQDEEGDDGYSLFGQFIKAQTPFSSNPSLLAVSGDRNVLETAVSWLTDISSSKFKLGLCELESNSDMEMDLIQEQQCLYWDFPLVDVNDVRWMRNFQVTKAIRATYRFPTPAPGDPERQVAGEGDVLVAITGAGDM